MKSRRSSRRGLPTAPTAPTGQRRRSRADAADRRAVHGVAVSRLTVDGGDAGGGARDQPQHVQGLMRRMGLAALGPQPRTTKPTPGHRIFPYLLRNLQIDRPNQVWAADITYVPIGRGCLYLVAVIDWASGAMVAWRLSNTMDVSFCVSALEEALARFGKPEIFNTDQGSQSPAPPSPAHSPLPTISSRWMGAGGEWTMSSSDCGAA
jgi:transposase InsO family protein